MTEPSANELVGRLTLADAMLGEVVTDMRRILAHANWPGIVREPGVALTTGRAARKLETELGHEAALATDALTTWIAGVKDVVDRRDRVVHAIALNQCMNCGEATMFRHPRSGEDVDRGPETVAAIEERYSDLRAQGLPLATEQSKVVNERILVEAKRIANETDEIQNPPQIYPQHVEHLSRPAVRRRARPVRNRVARLGFLRRSWSGVFEYASFATGRAHTTPSASAGTGSGRELSAVEGHARRGMQWRSAWADDSPRRHRDCRCTDGAVGRVPGWPLATAGRIDRPRPVVSRSEKQPNERST